MEIKSQSETEVTLNPAAIRRGMRLSILEGALSQPFYGLTWPSGVFLAGLALALGATTFQIGLLAALGPLLSGVNYISARWLERFKKRKLFYLGSSAVHRTVFLGVLLLPFMPERMRVPALIGIVAISTFFGCFQGTAWLSWIADIVPAARRGAFFSRRNMICTAVWLVISVLLGKFLDTHHTVNGFNLVFVGGVIFSLLALWPVSRQPDPPMALSEERPSLALLWRSAMALPTFRNLLLFDIAWGFTVNLADPFYNVYMLQSLKVDVARITLWGIASGVLALLTTPYWGFLGDKAGLKSTLLFGLIGSCVTAFGWLFVTQENLGWLPIVIFALSGFFDTGVGLNAFNLFLGVIPDKNKASYFGFYQAVYGLIVGISPALGGLLAESLPRMNLPFPGVDPLLILIGLSCALRVFPLLFIVVMPELGVGRGIGFMVKEFVLTNPVRLFTNLYYVNRSPDQKLAAIDSLSVMKSRAATPELVRSMNDLNPRVRQAAVQAIGEIGDSQAMPALIEALDDVSEDIVADAALALGKLGDPAATPSLMKKLDSDDAHLQRCAAVALGELRARTAAGPLIKLMQCTERTSVLLACADALGRLGEYRVVEPLLEITRTIRNTRIKHSVVASVSTLIDPKGELYQGLSEFEQHIDRAAEQILNPRAVRMAAATDSPFRKNLEDALQAFKDRNYNEAILNMKVLNQAAVREFLSGKPLKNALGFEPWVRLLDSDYGRQLDAIQRIQEAVGIALAIVDYYARHCPAAAEPDMDGQEFLLALYAFRASQAGLHRLIQKNVTLEPDALARLQAWAPDL